MIYAILHVAFLINCILALLLNNMSPYEKLYGKFCDISSCVSLAAYAMLIPLLLTVPVLTFSLF